MQTSSTGRNSFNTNNINDAFYYPSSSLHQRNNNQILERFLASIKSEVTREGVLSYIHTYMKFHHLYEGESQGQEQDPLNANNNDNKNKSKKKNNNSKNNLVYRYDWLIGDGTAQTIEKNIIDFVIHKRDEEDLGANGIDNYINPLANFYWVNGVKGIDWRLIKEYRPDRVKKTQDREYTAEEVIAIEEKLDVRGKVVSGIMRGSGVRRGAVPSISVGDLFPYQTKYGKIYKIIVYRGSSVYATACIPEIAERIDDYFAYRMRFGEACRLYGKIDHTHEYHDGDEVIQKWFKADEKHLDPNAPLIREDFDREDSLAAKYPRRISYEQITDIVRDAVIAAGIREVNKGQRHTRHKVMVTHGLRKLFKRRCRRQAKVDPIILERLLGHKNGNPNDRVTKLMMVYDPEEWAEMQAEFEKAIPHLTITKDAITQAKLEEAEAQLKNVPSIEQLQAKVKEAEETKKMLEEIKSKHENTKKELTEFINSREAQFEKHMNDILEARLKFNSPRAVLMRTFLPENHPALKILDEMLEKEEEKIKSNLRNEYKIPTE